MQAEIEVKFLDVRHDEVRERLRKAGAICKHPLRLMRRAIIDYPDRRLQTGIAGAWASVRVRDEGDRVTCTYKHVASDGKDSMHEVEFTISSYANAIEFFKAIGLVVYTEQETKRETWQLGDVEVELDEWPWLPPYIEIEGPSEAAVRQAAEKLGYDFGKALRGSSYTAYRMYYPKMAPDETVDSITHLTFSGQRPQWLTDRTETKGKERLSRNVSDQ